MSDLHLTDEQAEELKSMGPLGEDAAHVLWLWGECPAAPWDGISLAAIFRTEFDRNEPTSAFDAVEATICYARNTARLRAALVYWTLKEDSVRATMKNLHTEFDKFGPRTEISQIRKTVEAIVQALKELRRDHP